MFGNFLMKAMLKKQMKGVPEDQQEAIMAMIEKNPDFFVNLAQDIKKKMDGGMSQTDAVMSVMKENEQKLREISSK